MRVKVPRSAFRGEPTSAHCQRTKEVYEMMVLTYNHNPDLAYKGGVRDDGEGETEAVE